MVFIHVTGVQFSSGSPLLTPFKPLFYDILKFKFSLGHSLGHLFLFILRYLYTQSTW